MSEHRNVEALDLDPNEIVPHPMNPREDAAAGDLAGLVASVAEHGVLERLVLAPVPADLPAHARRLLVPEAEFLLIAGHRRLLAALEADLATVPVDIRHDLDTTKKQLAVIAAENIHRKDLSPLEEGDLYLALSGLDLTQTQISEQTGVAKGRVSERVRVAKLPTEARAKIRDGQVTLDQGLALGRLNDDPEAQAEIAKRSPFEWERLVNDRARRKDAEKRIETARKALVDAGVKILAEPPAEPGVDGEDVPEWAYLSDLAEWTPEFAKVLAEHRGDDIDLEAPGAVDEYLEDLAQEDVDDWHAKACSGHVVVEYFNPGNDWTLPHCTWPAVCLTPAAHADLWRSSSPAGSPAPGAKHSPEPTQVDPAVAARVKHLQQRADQRSAWAAALQDEATAKALGLAADPLPTDDDAQDGAA